MLDTVLTFLNHLLEKSRASVSEEGETGLRLGCVDVHSHYIADKVYSRTLGDIQMILDHRSTVIPYIVRERPDLFGLILQVRTGLNLLSLSFRSETLEDQKNVERRGQMIGKK